MIRRIFMILGVCFGALTAFVSIALLTRGSWQEDWSSGDSKVDLKPARPFLSESDLKPESAFALLCAAAKAESKLETPVEIQNELGRLNLEPWSDASFPLLGKMVAEGGQALDLARSAAAAPDPQVPTRVTLNHRTDYLQPLLRLNDLFRASAARKTAQGELESAFNDLATSMDAARILSRGGLLVDLLVDISSETRTCRALRLIALQQDIPGDVSRRMIEHLLNGLPGREPLAETLRQEYRIVPIMIQTLYDMPSGQLSQSGQETSARRRRRALLRSFGKLVGSSPEQMTADLERAYKSTIEIAAGPYDPKKIQDMDDRYAGVVKPHQLIWKKDPVGYLLARPTIPSLTRIITSYHRHALDLEATAVVLALRQFQQEERKTPASLSELVPQYLAIIPNDPFDGKPLRYRVGADGRWVVFSVGPNQIDEGGNRAQKEPRNAGDPGDVIYTETDHEWERQRLSSRNRGS